MRFSSVMEVPEPPGYPFRWSDGDLASFLFIHRKGDWIQPKVFHIHYHSNIYNSSSHIVDMG